MSTKSDVALILTELRSLRSETAQGLIAVNQRLDSVQTRIDTVIDAVAALRTDYDRHSHPDGGTPI